MDTALLTATVDTIEFRPDDRRPDPGGQAPDLDQLQRGEQDARGHAQRRAGRNFKVGHAGTLDPLASGLLIMAYGPFTKQLPHITGQDKTYTGTITLGHITPSYDLETDAGAARALGASGRSRPSARAFAQFHGEVDAAPAELLRQALRGRTRLLAGPRSGPGAPGGHAGTCRCIITRLEVTAIRGAEVDFEVDVSKGTYIRSLAHDIGQAAGLRRAPQRPAAHARSVPTTWRTRDVPWPGRSSSRHFPTESWNRLTNGCSRRRKKPPYPLIDAALTFASRSYYLRRPKYTDGARKPALLP